MSHAGQRQTRRHAAPGTHDPKRKDALRETQGARDATGKGCQARGARDATGKGKGCQARGGRDATGRGEGWQARDATRPMVHTREVSGRRPAKSIINESIIT